MASHKYTNEQLIIAIANSTSIAGALRLLGLADRGGNYATIHRKIKLLNLDLSHHKGYGWNRGISRGPKRNIKDYFSNKYLIGSNKLKQRLIKEKYFMHKCYHCNRHTWLGMPIPLELEHKDGDHHNNNLDNLTLLCPNCHANTTTYRGKNKNRNGGSRTHT